MEKSELYTHPPAQPVEPAAGEVTQALEIVGGLDVPRGAWDWIEEKARTKDGPHKYIETPKDHEMIVFWHNERPAALVLNLRTALNRSIQYRMDLDTIERLTHSPAPSARIGDTHDATILREAIRRLKRGGGKGSPSDYGYCKVCDQNESFRFDQVIEVLAAIADHAENMPLGLHDGIYRAAAPSATIERLEGEGEVAALREVVQQCANRFWEYVIAHQSKKTPDGEAKAQRNREMAELCDATLTTKDADHG